MSDLKPCPFCGGEASVVQQQESKMWTVGCLDVDCPGGWLSRDRDLLYFDKDEAVERWNSRAERTCKMETDHDELEVIAYSHEDTWAYKCNACDWSFRYDRGIKPNYCPNCGCKVVGE